MRNRLVKARLHPDPKPAFPIHQDDEQNHSSKTVALAGSAASGAPSSKSTPSKASRTLHDHFPSRSTLTPTSRGVNNASMSRTATDDSNGKSASPAPAPASLSPRIPNRMNSTIRTVPSFEARNGDSEEESGTDGTPSHSTSRDSGFSSSLNSNTSMSSAISQPRPNGVAKVPSVGRLRPSASATAQDASGGLLDAGFKTLKSRPSYFDIGQRESSSPGSGTTATATVSITPPDAVTDQPPGTATHENSNSGLSLASATEAQLSSGGWDNSVGKAGLGKTGRVINRLVSDNEALKRDIQIERLRAEESRQAARLLEDKLERVVSDYESRLLEANVTKTLLARKERQVESLQDALELERKRAVDAADRERVWKEEMERVKADAKRRIDEATNYAALCEGRYNAISGHWKEQGEEVRRAMGRMRKEVEGLAEERRRDDDKIETLRELCDQQDGNIRELRRQKDEILAQFERYKAQQEEALRDIKRRADEREREQERTLQEAREVLDKLRWALNVKATIDWAQ
ncbi:hypothetical protein VTK26DRAFT_6737 [Humicola hyalothermophila]